MSFKNTLIKYYKMDMVCNDVLNHLLKFVACRDLPKLKRTCKDLNNRVDYRHITKFIASPHHRTFHIMNLRNLTELHLHPNGLIKKKFLIHLPNLKVLGINYMVADSHISRIRSKLEVLICNYNYMLTDESLFLLPHLKYLDCGTNCNFTDAGILSLKNLEYLIDNSESGFSDKVKEKIKKVRTYNYYCRRSDRDNPNTSYLFP